MRSLRTVGELREALDAITDWADSGKYRYPNLDNSEPSVSGPNKPPHPAGDRMRGYNIARHFVASLLLKGPIGEPRPTVVYVCRVCGYDPGNTANWCNKGCGSDYNHMHKVDLEPSPPPTVEGEG